MKAEDYFKARKIFKKLKGYYLFRGEMESNPDKIFIRNGHFMSNTSAIEWATRKINKLEKKLDKL